MEHTDPDTSSNSMQDLHSVNYLVVQTNGMEAHSCCNSTHCLSLLCCLTYPLLTLYFPSPCFDKVVPRSSVHHFRHVGRVVQFSHQVPTCSLPSQGRHGSMGKGVAGGGVVLHAALHGLQSLAPVHIIHRGVGGTALSDAHTYIIHNVYHFQQHEGQSYSRYVDTGREHTGSL